MTDLIGKLIILNKKHGTELICSRQSMRDYYIVQWMIHALIDRRRRDMRNLSIASLPEDLFISSAQLFISETPFVKASPHFDRKKRRVSHSFAYLKINAFQTS